MSALQGLRIVELAENVAGEYCGKLLADFGAELIKVERPGGSPTRRMAPIIEGTGGRSESGLFAYLNTNKRSVVIDPDGEQGRARLLDLIASAACVIDDHDEDWLAAIGLSPDEFQAAFPGTVFCNVTNFGHGAPAGFRASHSINVMHASGWGYNTADPDDRSRPPLKGAGRFAADYDAGLDAATAALAALVGRERHGAGDYIDVSAQAAMASRADHLIGRMLMGELPVDDAPSAFDTPGPMGTYACQGGLVHIYGTPVHWAGLKEMLGNPAWAAEYPEDWLFNVQPGQKETFALHFRQWVADKQRDWVCDEAQRLGIPIVRVNDAADLLHSEQLNARGFFQELEHPVLGKASYPTVPYQLSATPARLETPAPALGEHDALIAAVPARAAAPAQGPQPAEPGRRGPLSGVRVLAITKVWAGPYAAKLLGFLGADVIKLESMKTLDSMRTFRTDDVNKSAIFQALAPGLKSVQLNMKPEKGQELLRRLIANSDIVIDNLRPGALPRMGLDYAGLRAIREDIIAVSLKMNGNTGPLASQTGYAPSFAALSGINTLIGYEGEEPRGVNPSYGDTVAGAAIAMGALAALVHRERTGEGQFVDVAATESITSMIGDSLFEYALTGRQLRHDGNRHADMAPHGAYPCRDGEWLCLAIDSEQAWGRLCAILRVDGLADDPRFATLAARQANLAALDAELSRLTADRLAAPLAAQLRQAGVAASKSLASPDLLADPILWQRGAFTSVTDAFGQQRAVVASPWRFARAGTVQERGAPSMGEHNEYVYCDILGHSREELARLVEEGIVL